MREHKAEQCKVAHSEKVRSSRTQPLFRRREGSPCTRFVGLELPGPQEKREPLDELQNPDAPPRSRLIAPNAQRSPRGRFAETNPPDAAARCDSRLPAAAPGPAPASPDRTKCANPGATFGNTCKTVGEKTFDETIAHGSGRHSRLAGPREFAGLIIPSKSSLPTRCSNLSRP